jgi:hypothetical protein
MSPADRHETFQARMSPEENAMLAALAERDGLTASDIVRSLIRKEYRATFGDKKPKPKK